MDDSPQTFIHEGIFCLEIPILSIVPISIAPILLNCQQFHLISLSVKYKHTFIVFESNLENTDLVHAFAFYWRKEKTF